MLFVSFVCLLVCLFLQRYHQNLIHSENPERKAKHCSVTQGCLNAPPKTPPSKKKKKKIVPFFLSFFHSFLFVSSICSVLPSLGISSSFFFFLFLSLYLFLLRPQPGWPGGKTTTWNAEDKRIESRVPLSTASLA